MENARCNVIYVDRAVSHDRFIQSTSGITGKDAEMWETAHIAENVGLLLDVFGEGLSARICLSRNCVLTACVQFTCAVQEAPV